MPTQQINTDQIAGGFSNNGSAVLRSRQTAAQSIPNAAFTTIALDTTDESTIFGASRTSGVLTLPIGTYIVIGGVSWGSSATGSRYARLLVDGVAVPGRDARPGVSTPAAEFIISRIVTVTSGTKTVALQGYQDSGGALSTAVAGTPQEVGSFLEVVSVGALANVGRSEVIGVALSDEATAITTGTAKVTMRMPFAMTLTAVRASLTVASSSGLPTVDINEAGVSILSTKLTIDASELTSTTALNAAVISDVSLADDAEITFDIDVAGTGAKGLKVWLIGFRA